MTSASFTVIVISVMIMPSSPDSVGSGSMKALIVGHNKGRTTPEKIKCNFGCAHPEGYRKALLKMRLAEKYGLPIVSFIDTPGAYPGVGSEQRGQAEAIAVNLREMSLLRTPIVSVVIGEGGSGGAPWHRCRRSGGHARAFLVLGHLPGRMCRDPLERGQRADERTGCKVTGLDRTQQSGKRSHR